MGCNFLGIHAPPLHGSQTSSGLVDCRLEFPIFPFVVGYFHLMSDQILGSGLFAFLPIEVNKLLLLPFHNCSWSLLMPWA